MNSITRKRILLHFWSFEPTSRVDRNFLIAIIFYYIKGGICICHRYFVVICRLDGVEVCVSG